jgi:Tfp pilus assembly protein PilX
MMIRRTRGFLLLPVALTLVLVGALAYAMTRDAGMNVTSVDAEYDTDVARYLAEAAVNFARWNNNWKCSGGPVIFPSTPLYRYSLVNSDVGTTAADLVGTMTMSPSSSLVTDNSNNDKGSLVLDVSGVTTSAMTNATASKPAASLRIVRTVFRYDLSNKRTATLTGGASTTISTAANPTPQGTLKYMELTEDGPGKLSYGLLQFNSLPKNALVRKATLRLRLTDTEIFPLLGRKLDIQRVTSAWNAGTAIWNFPWSKPGSDYAVEPVTSSLIGFVPDNYEWRIDALVAGWVDGTLANNGVLLKPTNLTKARFAAFPADTGGPQLVLEYYEQCK